MVAICKFASSHWTVHGTKRIRSADTCLITIGFSTIDSLLNDSYNLSIWDLGRNPPIEDRRPHIGDYRRGIRYFRIYSYCGILAFDKKISIKNTKMVIKEAEELWPLGQDVLNTLDEAVQMAEEVAAPPAERWVARAISDKLIPSLYDARTYLEVGLMSSPEIRLGILGARSEAGKLADTDSRYAPLYSKLRVLAEEADAASRIG